MRTTPMLLICGAVALAALAGAAEARVRVGVMIGVPGPWYPYPHSYYDYPPYYYYQPPPTVIAVPQTPITYIQQAPVEPAPANESTANYWYYCAAEKGYYPYVKQCPGGWKRVAPKPAEAP